MKNNQILPCIIYPAGNGYVSTLKPTVSGTGTPGAVINGTLDQMPFMTQVAETGTWSFTCDTSLTNKTEHVIVLTQTNQNGVSPQVTARFRTDSGLLTPHTVLFPYNNQLINTNAPVLSGTGKPGAIIEARLSGREYTTTVAQDSSWHISTRGLPEGLVKACVCQRDMGNASTDIHLNFTVDTKAPAEPVLDAPADNSFTKDARPVIRGRGEPGAVIDAVVDEKKYAAKVSPQGSWSVELGETLVDDVHIVSTRQKDQAGNQSPEKITLFTVKSKQPPIPAIDRPKNGEFTRDASPLLTGRGEKDCAIEAHIGERVFSTRVDKIGTWSMKVPLVLPEGATTIKLYQIDRAGNVSRNVDVSLVVDTKSPPPPGVIYPEQDGYVISPDFVVTGTGEPEALIECTLGSTSYKTRVQSDGSWQINVIGNDAIAYAMEYSLSVRQIDLAGNPSPCTRVSFRLDQNRLAPPDLSYPKTGAAISCVTPTLTGTGKSGATVHVNIKNETLTATVGTDNTWTLALSKPLCEGDTILNIYQTDAGNTSSVKTVRFRVDLSAPQPPVIISPIANQIVGGPLVISGSGENNATVTVRLDDHNYTAAVKNSTWVIPVTGTIENGIHCILADQADEAGNKSSCVSSSFVYYVDQQNTPAPQGPATYQIRYNPSGPEWTAETIITLKSDTPLSVNNVCGTIFSASVRKNGIYNFEYIDQNGCIGTVSAGVTWIDDQAPVVTVLSDGNEFSSAKTVQYFKPQGSAVSSALLNGARFESGVVIADEGFYAVEVRDQAGNVAREQFVIDKTPPTISGIENGKTYRSDVTLKFTDSLSGVKSAFLNGKNVLSCCTLAENGDYTLKVADYGGNTAEVNFKIQK